MFVTFSKDKHFIYIYKYAHTDTHHCMISYPIAQYNIQKQNIIYITNMRDHIPVLHCRSLWLINRDWGPKFKRKVHLFSGDLRQRFPNSKYSHNSFRAADNFQRRKHLFRTTFYAFFDVFSFFKHFSRFLPILLVSMYCICTLYHLIV